MQDADAGEAIEPVIIETAKSLDELCDWAKSRLPVSVAPIEGESRRLVWSIPSLKTAVRWALDESDAGLFMTGGQNDIIGATKSIYSDVANIVPTRGPARPLLAFVGLSPSASDAARGEALTGSDGRAFADEYLAPLGLTRKDVALTHVLPVAGELSAEEMAPWLGWIKEEIKSLRAPVVVALGKVAGEELGALAHFVLPHPAAIRKRGDNSGEVARKIRRIKQAMPQREAKTSPVGIAKASPGSQKIFGVVLDPYIIDQQNDWCPPFDVQEACHNYLENYSVVGLNHEEQTEATVIENFTVQYPTDEDHTKAMANQPHRAYRIPYGNQMVHSGAWVLGVRIKSADVWAQIERGEIRSFSIGGSGVRTPLDSENAGIERPAVEFIDLAPLL
jgi:uracil-DNA glycosylase